MSTLDKAFKINDTPALKSFELGKLSKELNFKLIFWVELIVSYKGVEVNRFKLKCEFVRIKCSKKYAASPRDFFSGFYFLDTSQRLIS